MLAYDSLFILIKTRVPIIENWSSGVEFYRNPHDGVEYSIDENRFILKNLNVLVVTCYTNYNLKFLTLFYHSKSVFRVDGSFFDE